jgi:tetratricopeptide (TPR) repeat protein
MLNNIGAAWDAQGEPGKALEYYEQALSIDKEVYSKRHPNVATDLNNIGSAWYALGDSQRAKEYFQQAYGIFCEFHGYEHPDTRTVKFFPLSAASYQSKHSVQGFHLLVLNSNTYPDH